MWHPIVAMDYAKERQRDLLAEAERYRMLKQIRAARPRLADHLARLLATASAWLHRQPVPQTDGVLERLGEQVG